MKNVYQCLVCGKSHASQEAAEKCHDGPIQAFQKGYDRFTKRKGLLGN